MKDHFWLDFMAADGTDETRRPWVALVEERVCFVYLMSLLSQKSELALSLAAKLDTFYGILPDSRFASRQHKTRKFSMKTFLQVIAALFLLPVRGSAELLKEDEDSTILLGSKAQECKENGIVAAWCDASNSGVECLINQETNTYACMCNDAAVCPEECIATLENGNVPSKPVSSRHGIVCQGIPMDEPNYVLQNGVDSLPSLHHCENNALVASWCNEATVPEVSCLVLPSLDEYVCTCMNNAAACPSECVGGGIPDRKTHNAIRCRGIPMDSPNYII
eukprot:scaffold1525_cov142-Cylindrotheca_fusiformis.AAC.15